MRWRARRCTPRCRGCGGETLHRELAEALEAAGAARQMRWPTHWLAAREHARAPRGAAARPPRRRRLCTPTAMPPGRVAGRWSGGRTPATRRPRRGPGSATGAAPSWRASSPRPPRLARARRDAGSLGHERRWATPSAGWPPSPSCGAREEALRRGGWPPRLPAPGLRRRGGGRAPGHRPTSCGSPARHGEADASWPTRPRAPGRAGRRVDLRARAVGLEGLRASQARRLRARARDGARSARAGARARPDGRWRRSSTSGSSVVLVRRGRLPPAPRRRSTPALDLCQRERRTPARSWPASPAWRTCCASAATGTRAAELVPRPDRAAARRCSSPRACSARSTPARAGQLGTAAALLVAGRRRARAATTTCAGHDGRAGPRRRGRGRRRRGARALSRAPGALGRPATTTITRSPACAGRPRVPRAARRRAALTRAPTCSAASPRDTGHPDALAALAQAHRRDGAASTATPTRRPSSSAAPSSCTAASTCRSNARSRAARRRRAGRGRRARARARTSVGRLPHRRASSARARWPPGRARVAALGESVVRRLGQRAAADADGGGLTRREREVVRLSRSGARTARSPRSCSSARARSTCTCATSCASSTAARASRPPAAPASSGSLA